MIENKIMDIEKIPSPCYVLDEALFRKNLELSRSVKERAGVNIILAFQGLPHLELPLYLE